MLISYDCFTCHWKVKIQFVNILLHHLFFAFRLFLCPNYITDEIKNHLGSTEINDSKLDFLPYDDILTFLSNLALEHSGKVWVCMGMIYNLVIYLSFFCCF